MIKFTRTMETPMGMKGFPREPRLCYTDPERIFAIEKRGQQWMAWHIPSGFTISLSRKTLIEVKQKVSDILEADLPVDWRESKLEKIFKNKDSAGIARRFIES